MSAVPSSLPWHCCRLLLASMMLPAAAASGRPPAEAATGEGMTIHVDPVRGGDRFDFDGTADRPLATIVAAQHALRQWRTASGAVGAAAEVVLAPGVHQVPAGGLHFSFDDSGTHFRAAGPGTVVSGGRQINDGWQRNASSGQLWCAPLPRANQTRQLYAFGRRAHRASVEWKSEWTALLEGINARGFIFSSELPLAAWPDVEQLEFVWTGTAAVWTECRCGVQAISQLTNGSVEIVMRQPCWTAGRERKPKGQNIVSPPTSVENSRAALSAPGDWVHADDQVYYWPRAGEDMTKPQISVPVEELLLHVEGTHSMTWQGVTFEQAGWLLPSTGIGYIEAQSGAIFYDRWCKTRLCTTHSPSTSIQPGAVTVSGGRDLSFESCTFRQLGASGIQLSNCTQRVNVSSCTFDDISGHGVMLGDTNDGDTTDPTLQNAFLRVVNSSIRNTPVEFHGNNPIFGGYLRKATIEHCDVGKCPHTAIAVGWGWEFSGYSSDNTVAANRVAFANSGCCGGAGAIYTLGSQNGTAIHANYIVNSSVRDNPQGQGAIHHDQGSRGIVTSNNVIDVAPEWARVHMATNISLIDNWSNAHKFSVEEGCTDIHEAGNINVTGKAFPPGALRVIEAAGLLP
jgi:hypothetical protein